LFVGAIEAVCIAGEVPLLVRRNIYCWLPKSLLSL
jgi:hypothetical protein